MGAGYELVEKRGKTLEGRLSTLQSFGDELKRIAGEETFDKLNVQLGDFLRELDGPAGDNARKAAKSVGHDLGLMVDELAAKIRNTDWTSQWANFKAAGLSAGDGIKAAGQIAGIGANPGKIGESIKDSILGKAASLQAGIMSGAESLAKKTGLLDLLPEGTQKNFSSYVKKSNSVAANFKGKAADDLFGPIVSSTLPIDPAAMAENRQRIQAQLTENRFNTFFDGLDAYDTAVDKSAPARKQRKVEQDYTAKRDAAMGLGGSQANVRQNNVINLVLEQYNHSHQIMAH
jgi:hypothetical protein